MDTIIRFALLTAIAIPRVVAQQSFEVKPSEIRGLEVFGSATSEFREVIARLIPNEAVCNELQPALSRAALVKNYSAGPILAMAIRYDYLSRTNYPLRNVTHKDFPRMLHLCLAKV